MSILIILVIALAQAQPKHHAHPQLLSREQFEAATQADAEQDPEEREYRGK